MQINNTTLQKIKKERVIILVKNKVISNWDKLPVALDLHTVALILGVTDVTVKNWLYNGTIKGSKVGHKWLFDKEYIKSIISNT